MNIEGLVLEGTSAEVAEQIFKQMIGPMFDHINKTNPQAAIEFGYCVAGNAIACYLNCLNDVDQAEKLIIDSTKSMAADVKRSRTKVC